MREQLIVDSREYAQALVEIMNAGGRFVHNGRAAKIVACEVIDNTERVESDGSILGNTPGVYFMPHPETYVFMLEVE